MNLSAIELHISGMPLSLDVPHGAVVSTVDGGVYIRRGPDFALAIYDGQTTSLPSREEMKKSHVLRGNSILVDTADTLMWYGPDRGVVTSINIGANTYHCINIGNDFERGALETMLSCARTLRAGSAEYVPFNSDPEVIDLSGSEVVLEILTESDWHACADPEPMLEFLKGKTSDRKFRLYACADCRRHWSWFDRYESEQRAIEVGESFADGLATAAELTDANNAKGLSGSIAFQTTIADAADGAWGIAHCIADAVTHCVEVEEIEATEAAEKLIQSQLVRELFGNPFQPIAFDSQWQTESIVNKAREIYDNRTFSELPHFANLLADAGCNSVEILEHCRSATPHARGCWVLDLVLSKQ